MSEKKKSLSKTLQTVLDKEGITTLMTVQKNKLKGVPYANIGNAITGDPKKTKIAISLGDKNQKSSLLKMAKSAIIKHFPEAVFEQEKESSFVVQIMGYENPPRKKRGEKKGAKEEKPKEITNENFFALLNNFEVEEKEIFFRLGLLLQGGKNETRKEVIEKLLEKYHLIPKNKRGAGLLKEELFETNVVKIINNIE